MSLAQMSISGGALVLFIAVVRALALRRLPKAAFLALWEMAALRLLLPVSLPVPFSVLGLVKGWLAAGKASAQLGPGVVGAAMPSPAHGSGDTILGAVWLAGAVLMAAYFSTVYVCGRRIFRTSVPDGTPAVRQWLSEQKLRRPLEVRQSDQVSSPLAYGVFRPVILLPKGMECGGGAALSCVLTHELVHVRRFDAVAKLAFAAALCVHWFNPLVWAMYALASRDLELSCDERVMGILGGREKASYALALISLEETRSRRLSLYNHFGKIAIEERIEAIMKYKKASVWAVALAVALVIGATTAFAAATDGTGLEDAPVGEVGMKFYEYKIIDDADIASSGQTGSLPGADGVLGESPMVVLSRKEESACDPGAEPVEKVEWIDLEGENIIWADLGELLAVRPSDESRFTPEEWAEILEKIERGEMYWQAD